ncbi:MAG: hypothetical protein HKN24_04000 [Acidimicrobiales bacterium]|nr:hypothetical protein [Acidimicrobiales bacterium]
MSGVESSRRANRTPLLAAMVAATLTLIVTSTLYLWLNPQLERRSDWLRETQGALFSLIPVGTAVAALLAWYAARSYLERTDRARS